MIRGLRQTLIHVKFALRSNRKFVLLNLNWRILWSQYLKGWQREGYGVNYGQFLKRSYCDAILIFHSSEMGNSRVLILVAFLAFVACLPAVTRAAAIDMVSCCSCCCCNCCHWCCTWYCFLNNWCSCYCYSYLLSVVALCCFPWNCCCPYCLLLLQLLLFCPYI